jgi:multiple sugar transport system substrate-binding protein
MGKASNQMNNFSKMMPRRDFLAAGGLGLSSAALLGPLAQFASAGAGGGNSAVEVIAASRQVADWVLHTSKPWARRNNRSVTVRTGVVQGKLDKNQVALIPPKLLGTMASLLGKVPGDLLARQEVSWPDVLPVWRERLSAWRGSTVAVPVQGDMWVQVIRSDWLADDSLQNAHQKATGKPLRVPRFWEEWVELGKALHGKLPGRAGAPVLPPLPQASVDQLRLLRQVAACFAVERLAAGQRLRSGKEAENNHYALDFDLLTGKPKVGGQAFVQALEWLTRQGPYRPSQTESQPWQAFARGEAMLAIVPANILGELQRGPLRDRFDIHPLPGADKVFLEEGLLQAGQGNAIPLVGSEGAMAVADTGAEAAVWDLIAYLVQPKVQLDLVLDPKLGGPVREQHLQGAPWDGLQLDARRLAQWQSTLRATLSPAETVNPVVALRTPDADKLDAELGKQVGSCLAGRGAPAECLKAAAEAWTALGRERPERLAEVRASAGLT